MRGFIPFFCISRASLVHLSCMSPTGRITEHGGPIPQVLTSEMQPVVFSLDDTLLTLAQAARHLPRRASGKPIHVATLYRWARDGCRGVFLETVQVGHQSYTTEAALQEFIKELTKLRRTDAGSRGGASTCRQAAVRDADRAASGALASGEASPSASSRMKSLTDDLSLDDGSVES